MIIYLVFNENKELNFQLVSCKSEKIETDGQLELLCKWISFSSARLVPDWLKLKSLQKHSSLSLGHTIFFWIMEFFHVNKGLEDKNKTDVLSLFFPINWKLHSSNYEMTNNQAIIAIFISVLLLVGINGSFNFQKIFNNQEGWN